jgi:hypothetical protein
MRLIGCRRISAGIAEGELVISRKNFSFLGDVNPETGVVEAEESDIRGENISNKIFAFPSGKGSTVGTFVLLRMKKSGTAPAGIINYETEPVIAVGAIISGIPLVDRVDLSLLESGMRVRIFAEADCRLEILD